MEKCVVEWNENVNNLVWCTIVAFFLCEVDCSQHYVFSTLQLADSPPVCFLLPAVCLVLRPLLLFPRIPRRRLQACQFGPMEH